jgi:GTP-binding protein
MERRDADSALPLVAVVGRPNVGKSTLFNRLVGSRKALVEDSPGVTRDRHYAAFDWVGHRFRIVDTGGYDTSNESLIAAIRRQTEYAIAEADAIVFVVDSSEGLLPSDLDAWAFLRRARVPVFVAANKVDEGVHEARLGDFARLGVEPVFPISALHGRGVADLLDALVEENMHHSGAERQNSEGEQDGGNREQSRNQAGRLGALAVKSSSALELRVPRIAVIGKPNVGKSTLVNRLLGEERYITSDRAGTTRDAIDSTVEIAGRTYTFIDTAGMRQRARIKVLSA